MALDPKKLAAFAKGGGKKPPFGKKKGGGKPDEDEDKDDDRDEDEEDDDHDDEDEEHDHGDGDGDHDDHDDGDDGDHEDVDVDEAAGELDDLDPKVRKLAKGYDPEKHGNPPQWVEDEDTWEKAKEAVDPEGEGADKYDEPWAVAAAVYKKMGGAFKQGKSK